MLGAVWYGTARHSIACNYPFSFHPSSQQSHLPLIPPHPTPAVRTFDQRTVLDMFSGRITAVSLSGYLFFGRWGCVGAVCGEELQGGERDPSLASWLLADSHVHCAACYSIRC